jgi:hypothetical protein
VTDIVEFLRARLDEDEDAAHRATAPAGWTDVQVAGLVMYKLTDHAERWTPQRVLREVEAKRRIVEDYAARDGDVDLMLGPDCRRQREWGGLRLAVLALAAAHSDHPDYQQRWAT